VSIVLIGFMGAGKSTAARALAGADSDALVEAELGCSIEAFFDREGEAAFREVEERVVCELLDRAPDVVALGGDDEEAVFKIMRCIPPPGPLSRPA